MASNDRNTSKDTTRNANAQNAQKPRGDDVGNEQSARSEEELDRETRSLIGNTAEDRNLSGSTTYVTLPEQQGDQSQNQSSRQASSSQGNAKNSSQPGNRGDSLGSSRGDTQR